MSELQFVSAVKYVVAVVVTFCVVMGIVWFVDIFWGSK